MRLPRNGYGNTPAAAAFLVKNDIEHVHWHVKAVPLLPLLQLCCCCHWCCCHRERHRCCKQAKKQKGERVSEG